MVRDALKKIGSPVNLALEISNVLAGMFLNKGNVGIARASLSAQLVDLALKMRSVPKAKLVPVWLESHAAIKAIAHKKALLTIYDSVYPTMAGTRELELFRQYMNQ
jgi:predicted nucleic acid-binding protein